MSAVVSGNGNRNDAETPYALALDTDQENPGTNNDGDNENSDDNNDGDHHTLTSTVLTAEGIHDFPGFVVVCWVILLGDMSRGVFFPSMWPLIEQLGGTEVTLGYAVAAFSFGRVLVNPLFGSWSHKYGYTFTLQTASFILWCGTIMYSLSWKVGRCEFLIVAQTVLGVGSGTLGVTRAFVADVTAQRLRTQYMGWITAVQYGGFTVTPLIGYALNIALGDSNLWSNDNQDDGKNTKWFVVNRFTAPAYFMTSIVTFVLILLATTFQDRHRITIRKERKRKSLKRAAIDEEASRTVPVIGITAYDCCIAGCMLLNVATKGSIAAFETMGVAVAESHFSDQVAQVAGLIVGVSGLIGVIVLLHMGHLTAIWTDIQLIVGGMLIMMTGVAVWAALDDDPEKNAAWKYVVTIILIYAVGYPVGHTALIGLFSKIVGRRPQGTLLGWFASAGSVARMIFPIMSGYVSRYGSIQMLFAIVVGVLVTATIVTTWSRRILTVLSQ